MKFLAMHITNQKLSFDIFTVGNLQNIFMEHDRNILMIFWHKRKMYNFDSYNVLLSIDTNIPVLLMTAFVLQGHIYDTHLSVHPPDICTGPTGTETGLRSSALVWTAATGRCWCRKGWGCPTLWPLTPRAGSSAGRTQVSFTFSNISHDSRYYCWKMLMILSFFIITSLMSHSQSGQKHDFLLQCIEAFYFQCFIFIWFVYLNVTLFNGLIHF